MTSVKGREALIPAFLATSYHVDTPAGSFDLRIGLVNPGFDGWLRSQGAVRWGIVTPENPAAQRIGEARNRERRHRFEILVTARGWRHLVSRHLADAGDWPDETGLLLLDADVQTLRTLSGEFGQCAFVAGETGSAPRLVWV